MKKFLILCLSILFTSPLLASGIGANATSAPCDNATLETYNGTANVEINWEPNTINLSWYNGDTQLDVQSSAQSCVYDGGLTVPSTQPTRTGYTFVGWRLRVPHTPVNGVTNSANTIVHTGIYTGSNDIEFEVRVKPTTGSFYIFQSRDSTNDLCGIAGENSGSKINFSCGNGRSAYTSIVRYINHIYYIRGAVKNGNLNLYVKDETTNEEDSGTTQMTGVAPNAEICLFGNTKGNYINPGNTIYMAKLRIDGNLVLDYIPATQDDKVGFFDDVSNTFITASSGSLTAGNPL